MPIRKNLIASSLAFAVATAGLGAAVATPAFAKHGADDPAGHVSGGQGKDDGAGHGRHGADDAVKGHRAKHGADDGAGHKRHGGDDVPGHVRHGGDDAPGHH